MSYRRRRVYLCDVMLYYDWILGVLGLTKTCIHRRAFYFFDKGSYERAARLVSNLRFRLKL